MSNQLIQAFAWLAAFAALSASAWRDLRSRIIPNELVGVVAVSGFCLSVLVRPDQIWLGLIVVALLVVGMGAFAHFGVMGGGDVKLIAASTLLFPPASAGQLLVWITLAGGVLSITYLLARSALRSRNRHETLSPQAAEGDGEKSKGWLSDECDRIAAGGPMPYGIAIFGGVIGTKAGLYTCLHANFCWL